MLGQVLESKPTLFSVTAVVVVMILAIPVIIPHMLHGYHMAHIALHIIGLTLALFLTVLAVTSYHRTKSRRLLISTLAFACFAASEVVVVIYVAWPPLTNIGILPMAELGHLLVFAALGLLAMAVFRND
ncbi:MAG: hypothetical protein F4Y82_06050 [Cenarchaeum sp. SB0665_bin_23]|nr:hypothetical protein [Cenarchaeum sp. SB0667_bin_13]MXY61653.1 hypothetical protein [Cenarchaeum sp. SB0665_bin_23]MYB46352.1 hypothetical protein [Cenarchaeum sp. SB0662_bin_33]MYC79514.1 hypothetical protein [Cenarchaeum sp. SB0661_bin_35]MYD58669.1 hypothetical protein [Cenarchaeum sp. SB0678_bin_8]MYG33507.1 hypothetical protein [Cenarchaeum sp. SB0677_bin_16]MYI52133.1 hypothetical protein [Cenarchaeum sp. SB0673_bin_9]MYJ28056.1 hypothetical protein [Cenarchaeum sp. SB0672_bin_9]